MAKRGVPLWFKAQLISTAACARISNSNRQVSYPADLYQLVATIYKSSTNVETFKIKISSQNLSACFLEAPQLFTSKFFLGILKINLHRTAQAKLQ